jgi:hypothetical protein
VETSAQLPPSPSARTIDTSTATQAVPASIEKALNKVIGTREVALDAPDAALKVMTRRLKDADVYLFFNEGAQASSNSVTLKTSGKRVESWDPATGSVSPVTSTAGKGAVTVKLELKPYETELLTIR